MAEGARGSAMRTYQILLVLGFGFLAGRLPALLEEGRSERDQLLAAAAPAPAATVGRDAELSLLAAEVAARVSSETVARLIAAGWAPRGEEQRLIVQQLPAPPQRGTETVVRVVAEPPRATAGWEIRPGDLPAQTAAVAPRLNSPTATSQQPAAKPAQAPPVSPGYAFADAGYAALRKGEKAEAARQLEAALAADPNAPQAETWRADLRQLRKRWALSFYTMAREGAGDPLAASPVLGGGQSGAMLAWRPNPLGKVPVAVFGRFTAAAGKRSAVDPETAEAALGVRVEPLKGVPVAIDVERRFALGTMSRNAWSARISGGAARSIHLASLPFQLDGWGEAGIVGFHARPDYYAGAQLRGGTPVAQLGRTAIDVGAGGWAAVQRGWGATASRVDLGPSARFRIRPYSAYAQLDYRARVAGNAMPGSGPVVTIAADF